MAARKKREVPAFEIGDKIKFKTEVGYPKTVPIFGTEADGIPKKYIIHGSTDFKKNEGVVKHKCGKFYIVCYKDEDNDDVQLGFCVEDLKLLKRVGGKTFKEGTLRGEIEKIRQEISERSKA